MFRGVAAEEKWCDKRWGSPKAEASPTCAFWDFCELLFGAQSPAKAVIFNRLGDLRDRSFESQRYRASRLNLAVAAIVAWNTVYLERAVASLSVPGKEIRTDLLTHLSPLGWKHITLPGITFGTPTNVSLKGALPLRAPIQVSFWSYRAKNSVS
jgi:hypothetical protein